MKSLSSFSTYGAMGGAFGDPWGSADHAPGAPVEYGGVPSSTAWYSYQEGLAGYGIIYPWDSDDVKQAKKDAAAARRGQRELERKSKSAERVRRIKLGKSGRKQEKLGRKREKLGKAYRIVRLEDGTVLKQTGNNEYVLMKVGGRKSMMKHKPRHKVGEKITQGHHHWSELHYAVLSEHGPFSPGATVADWMQLATVGGGIGLDLARAFGKKKKRRRRRRRRSEPEPVQAAPGIPKQYLFIGGGVLGLVLLVVLLKK